MAAVDLTLFEFCPKKGEIGNSKNMEGGIRIKMKVKIFNATGPLN